MVLLRSGRTKNQSTRTNILPLEFGSWFFLLVSHARAGGLSPALYEYNEQAATVRTPAREKNLDALMRTAIELFIVGVRVGEPVCGGFSLRVCIGEIRVVLGTSQSAFFVSQASIARIGSNERLNGLSTRPRISRVTAPRSGSSPGSPKMTGVCPSPCGKEM